MERASLTQMFIARFVPTPRNRGFPYTLLGSLHLELTFDEVTMPTAATFAKYGGLQGQRRRFTERSFCQVPRVFDFGMLCPDPSNITATRTGKGEIPTMSHVRMSLAQP